MSRNHNESDFSGDFGKTIPINRRLWLWPVNHREHGLQTGVYLISTADFNVCEFSVDGGWYRMEDYFFGAVEPE